MGISIVVVGTGDEEELVSNEMSFVDHTVTQAIPEIERIVRRYFPTFRVSDSRTEIHAGIARASGNLAFRKLAPATCSRLNPTERARSSFFSSLADGDHSVIHVGLRSTYFAVVLGQIPTAP